MYNILVISDTHKKIGHVIDLIKDFKDLNHIIHLGDVVEDAEDIKAIYDVPIAYVAGNCDFYEKHAPNKLIVSIKEKNFYLTHGHREGVKYSTDTLHALALTNLYQVILFGHTHRPLIEYEGKTIILNPGSISEPRYTKYPTYALIQIDEKGRIYATLNELKKV